MRLHQRLRREQARHTDDWLITYADTITLLLCLFVVILSIRTADKRIPLAPATPVSHALEAGDMFAGHPPFGTLMAPTAHVIDERPPLSAGDSVEPAREAHLPGYWAEAGAPPNPSDVLAEPDKVPPRPAGVSAGTTTPSSPVVRRTQRDTEELETAPVALPAVVDRLKSVGTILVQQNGDRITTLQISSAAFFGSGYSTLSGSGKSILRDVAVTLKGAEFASYHISIEGHTDDMPISTVQFQSNWELSTARAAAVVRFLLEEGIPARKLTAAGYADTFPIMPNRNADGTVIPENQAMNRRVVIKLEKIERAER